jgi:erythromycin esterase
MNFRALALAASAAAVPLTAAAQQPLNLDFERAAVNGSGGAWGWSLGWSAFQGGSIATFLRDSAVVHGGRYSLRITVPDSEVAPTIQTILLQSPSGFARGHRLRLSGWLRAGRGFPPSRVLLTLEAWKNGEFAAADTARLGGPDIGLPERWQQVVLDINVPDDATIHSIVIGASLDGTGSAWFDDLSLSVDGRRITTLPLDPPPPSGKDLAWLSSRSAPLFPDSGLAAFDSLVGSATIVGLGESTHGTHEFFETKARLVEHLVRTQGVRVFGIEANQLAAERINRFVAGGEGSAPDVMKVLFRVWNTEEVLQLVEWLRTWNIAHPDAMVRFAGFDMQDHRTPADTLRAFLLRAEPSFVTRFDSLTGEYLRQPRSATPSIPDSVRAGWLLLAEQIWMDVSTKRGEWLARASSGQDSASVEWAVQSANLYRQAARFNVGLNSPERDSLMAANVAWLVTQAGAGSRIALWAHDVHISAGGDPERSFNSGAQMGAYLRRWYGDGYRPVSLLTWDGAYSATMSFTDRRIIEAVAFPGPPNSLEGALHSLRRPAGSSGFIVNLRGALGAPGGRWLTLPRPIRHVGYAAYDYGFELKAVIPLEFDGVVFIDHTTPSRMLR